MLLVDRGQQAGLIRADLVPDDMQRVLGMLISVLWNTDPGDRGLAALRRPRPERPVPRRRESAARRRPEAGVPHRRCESPRAGRGFGHEEAHPRA
ncbi:hypothetical protein [Streptomyces sp. NBC_00005]|uniref:hypothetical protein n=1 Tax=Streptomyces sp. NBC_00005 TaxID=2903609 RepID=UPI00324F1C16